MAATQVLLEWSDGQSDSFAVGGTLDRTVTENTAGQVRAAFTDDDGSQGPWTSWVSWSAVVTTLNFIAPELRDATTYLRLEAS